MIVCSCNVVSDKKIKEIVRSGACPRTLGAVYKCLGCGPNCGRCVATLKTIINEALAEAMPVARPTGPCEMDMEILCTL